MLLELEGSVILPGRRHGNYEYGDSLVSMELGFRSENWYDSHRLLSESNARMLTLMEFIDFLNLLKSGNAFDGNGKKISEDKLTCILNEITEVKGEIRAEWLDAEFKFNDNKLHMNFCHNFENNALRPKYSADISNSGYLDEDRTPRVEGRSDWSPKPNSNQNKISGIDMNDWLTRSNIYGLPTTDVTKGSLHYYKPGRDNNSVAGFGTSSSRARLSCVAGPYNFNSTLGVRAVRIKD